MFNQILYYKTEDVGKEPEPLLTNQGGGYSTMPEMSARIPGKCTRVNPQFINQRTCKSMLL
jgi:hypothetical protein